MRTKEAIDKEIEGLRVELQNVVGREASVFTRICGYYRATRNFNLGKVEEYNARKAFTIPVDCKTVESMV